jgi:hypothetical protein
MSWWGRIKGKLGDKSTSERESDPEQPRAKWLPASATPFGVPVLDLISVTGTYLSATRDPEQAQRAVSWRTSIGDELDATVLQSAPELACSLRYPIDPLASDGLLFCPSEMEHKWVLALRGDQILIAHSWTGSPRSSRCSPRGSRAERTQPRTRWRSAGPTCRSDRRADHRCR